MIKLIMGNEPYLIKNYKEKIKKEITFPEMNISYMETFDTEEYNSCYQYPLIDKKRIIFLSLDKLSSEMMLLEKYIENPCNSTDLIITIQILDKRNGLYKKLNKNKMVQEFNKLNNSQLETFILSKATEYNINFQKAAIEKLLTRCGYQSNEYCTLFTLDNYIKQLSYCSDCINETMVNNFVEETLDEKSFVLFSYILDQKADKALRLVQYLLETGEQPIGLLSLLLRNYRIAYKYMLLRNSMSFQDIAKTIGVPAFQMQFCKKLIINQDAIFNNMTLLQDAVDSIKKGMSKNIVIITISKLLNNSYKRESIYNF